jgi:hypothetical protein
MIEIWHVKIQQICTFSMTEQKRYWWSPLCSLWWGFNSVLQGPGWPEIVYINKNPSIFTKTYTTQYHRNRTNLAHGSQPLRPTARLRFTGYGLPFPYFPWAKQVAEYRAVPAPILKPPTPSLTAIINGDWSTKDYQDSSMLWKRSRKAFFVTKLTC